jgi:hypothetical protein
MYSEVTMDHLSHIVDSLHLKFRSCDLDRTYYAKTQSIAHYVTLKEGDLTAARRDMSEQLPFEEFVKKYPNAEMEDSLLVTKERYQNYDNLEVIKFSSICLDGGYGHHISWENEPERYNMPVKGRWSLSYWPGGDYSEPSLSAFYFLEEFSAPALPERYARLVQYTDCLIDTSGRIYRETAIRGDVMLPNNLRKLSMKKKQQLLEEMRRTRVVGYCSQDQRPRTHARNIAILSAETANWEVFLRAHLDILNDRFDRASDGSYAWSARETYIRELEALDINVSDLMLGISLRVENPSQNHYYGSIRRTGRALAESKDVAAIADRILTMIADPQLDNYNRVLLYYLFLNMHQHLPEGDEKARYAEQLKEAVSAMPYYLARTME